MASMNPRVLRVACDDVSVTLYQIVSEEAALAATVTQLLVKVQGVSPARMIWFKTSFTQVMHALTCGSSEVRGSKVLAIRIKYRGLEDILLAGRLSYPADVTTSGVLDRTAPVHVIWDVARDSMGNKDRSRKVMHIGVLGEFFVKLLEDDAGTIISVKDVTKDIQGLKTMVDQGDEPGAEAVIASISEEDLPLDNEEIDANLGML